MEFYKKCIGDKYPHCCNIWGALDGLKVTIQAPCHGSIQNRVYNGWTHGHYVNCLFIFAPYGRIRTTIYNAPGTFHDSAMADYGIYATMESIFERTGGKVVVDSAFRLSGSDFIIMSSQLDPLKEESLLINREATSIRQLSEWGMRMIQAQFPRIKDNIQYEDEGERKIMFRLMCHLYNYQTHNIGHNIILNSYMQKKDGYYGYDNITEDANDYINN